MEGETTDQSLNEEIKREEEGEQRKEEEEVSQKEEIEEKKPEEKEEEPGKEEESKKEEEEEKRKKEEEEEEKRKKEEEEEKKKKEEEKKKKEEEEEKKKKEEEEEERKREEEKQREEEEKKKKEAAAEEEKKKKAAEEEEAKKKEEEEEKKKKKEAEEVEKKKKEEEKKEAPPAIVMVTPVEATKEGNLPGMQGGNAPGASGVTGAQGQGGNQDRDDIGIKKVVKIEPFEEYSTLAGELRHSLTKLIPKKTEPSQAEAIVFSLADILKKYLEKNDPALKATDVWDLVKTVSKTFLEVGSQSPLWFDFKVGYYAAHVLLRITQENPEKDIWETSETLGKSLALLMDSVYIGSIQENVQIDRFASSRPEITQLGLEIHELCLKKAAEISHQGWVRKQGNRIKTWKKRLLVLHSSELVYSEKEDGNSVKGRIPLYAVLNVERKKSSADPSKPTSFTVTTAGRTFVIESATAAEADEWVKMISAAVSASQGLLVSSFVLKEDAGMEEDYVRKVVIELVPTMVKMSSVTCTKLLAGLLSNYKGHF